MIQSRLLGWFFFGVWAVWLFALHAWIGGGGSPLSETPARWMPDLGLVLALSLLARVEVADAPWIALVAAFTRAAFSAEPPIVLLTGFLGIVLLALVARSAVELTGPLWRALAALVLVFTFDLWLAFAHSMRLPVGSESVPFSMFAAWPAAISSALLALLLGPSLAHLPGLTPLRRRQW